MIEIEKPGVKSAQEPAREKQEKELANTENISGAGLLQLDVAQAATPNPSPEPFPRANTAFQFVSGRRKRPAGGNPRATGVPGGDGVRVPPRSGASGGGR
ncbi:MAG: hypothetical protein IID42_03925 [Planctomycetes bacterium]|nr:hypothetical protein [Planctomycetota bacterium]